MNDNLVIYGILFVLDYDIDNDILKKYLKDVIYCFFYRINFVVNGKNSLYWEIRDRNIFGR